MHVWILEKEKLRRWKLRYFQSATNVRIAIIIVITKIHKTQIKDVLIELV